jgi:predicted transcriptional regulator
MKDTITQQLDDKDIECANLLRQTGFRMCVAKVIVSLKTKSKTQKEIARCIDANQGDISVALRELISKNLVNISETIHDGVGRPYNKYILVALSDVIDTIEKAITQKYENEQAMIERLKELTH